MPKRNFATILRKSYGAKKFSENYDALDNLPKDFLFRILANPYEAIIIVNAEGIVQFMSKSLEPSYKLKAEAAIGRNIAELNPNTRLPMILKTGKAEIGRSAIVDDRNQIVARIPIKRRGRIIGAIGKVTSVYPDNLKEIFEKIVTLESNIDYYKSHMDFLRQELYQTNRSRYSFENILGNSEKLSAAKDMARKAARSDLPVSIIGESGTGKELFAHAIHQASRRSENAFVRVNCASIPESLIESELFGYEPGSFTGANKKGKIGKFELAHNGTIFLDEIGDMPLNTQVKLMRVIQEKEIEKIGANDTKRVDFRLITATNRNLEEMVKKRTFRLDLLYRINVVMINLPPLREMKEDIPLIARHFLSQLNHLSEYDVNSIHEEAMAIFKNYSWPGNIRELNNVIQRALITCSGNQIEIEDLPNALRRAFSFGVQTNDSIPLLKDIVEKTEKQIIMKALKLTGFNKRRAARLLGINRSVLYYKIRNYEIAL